MAPMIPCQIFCSKCGTVVGMDVARFRVTRMMHEVPPTFTKGAYFCEDCNKAQEVIEAVKDRHDPKVATFREMLEEHLKNIKISGPW